MNKKVEAAYNTWSDEEKGTLRILYEKATREEIMAAIPNRTWKTICEQAHALGLHRSFKAKGDAIRAGRSHAQRVAICTAYENFVKEAKNEQH